MSQLFQSSPTLFISRFVPMLCALMIVTHLQFLSAKQTSALVYISTFIEVGMMSLPMLLAHLATYNKYILKRLIYWSLGFVVYPVALFTLQTLQPTFLNAHLSFDGVMIFIGLSLCSIFIPLVKFKLRSINSGYLQTIKIEDLFMLIALGAWVILMCLANIHDEALTLTPNTLVISLDVGVTEFKALIWTGIQSSIIAALIWVIYWLNKRFLIAKLLGQFGLFNYLCGTFVYLLICTPIVFSLINVLPISGQTLLLIPSNAQGIFQPQNYVFTFSLIALSTPIILLCRHHRTERKLFELEQQNKQAELTLLQQQINPHFLFNSLNNIYGKVLCQSDDAPNLIEHLSSLLQHSVYKGHKDFVSLEDELNYIKHFIELQKVRLSGNINLSVNLPRLNTSAHQIAPLLLIVPIENAFKHAIANSLERCNIRIDCQLEGNRLALTCENSFSDQMAKDMKQSEEHTGVGLQNLSKRLSLIYANTHQLNYGPEGDHWQCNLEIELT